MGTHPIFESDFDCLTEFRIGIVCIEDAVVLIAVTVDSDWIKEMMR